MVLHVLDPEKADGFAVTGDTIFPVRYWLHRPCRPSCVGCDLEQTQRDGLTRALAKRMQGSCGRIDLPDSDSDTMYESLQKCARCLGEACVLYPGHNYGGPSTTVGREKREVRVALHRSYQLLGRRCPEAPPLARIPRRDCCGPPYRRCSGDR